MLDNKIEQALDRACLVPGKPDPRQDTLRVLRGQLVLASIAGLAYRNISNYAGQHTDIITLEKYMP